MAIEKNIPHTLIQEGLPFSCLINTTINLFEDGLALGIYCLLASKPSGWGINNQYLMNKFKIGRDLCKKKLTYIKSLGLISHEKVRDEKGRITHVNSTLHRTPIHSTENQYSGPNIHSTGLPGYGGSAPIKKGDKSSSIYNNISTSGEVPNLDYDKFDDVLENKEKSDYELNQLKKEELCLQDLSGEAKPIKSDYCETQINKYTKKSKNKLFDIKIILNDNPFALSESMIQDWIITRTKKRAAITQTAWNKINKELTKCKEQGIDPTDAFETMVASGWQSLKVEYFIKEPDRRNSNNTANFYEESDATWVMPAGAL